MWENKKVRWIAAGATTIGLSYLLYKLYGHLFPPPSPPPPRKDSLDSHSHQQPRLRTVHSNYSEFYFDKQEQLRLVVSMISPKGPSLEQIYLLSPIIIVDEYLKYTKEIRKRRRLIRKVNEDQYVNLIRTYEIEVKELLERGRLEVLEEYGLSMDDLQKMETAYEMFDDPQALKKKAFAELQHKTFIGAKLRRIPKDKLRKILEEEINFISNKMYERIKLKLEDNDTGITQEEIYKVITTLCDDIIFEKYGYEREEIESQLPEVPLLTKDLKKQRQALFANLVEFNIDSMQSPDQDAEVQSQPQQSSKSVRTKFMDSGQNSDLQ